MAGAPPTAAAVAIEGGVCWSPVVRSAVESFAWEFRLVDEEGVVFEDPACAAFGSAGVAGTCEETEVALPCFVLEGSDWARGSAAGLFWTAEVSEALGGATGIELAGMISAPGAPTD